MAAADEGAAMNIKVHPLVVMSIADHHTRDKIQVNRDRVFGCMFGTQAGRDVNILEAFEIAWTTGEDGAIQIEQKAFEEDQDLFKEAYAGYECLGWYSTGPAPTDKDLQLHQIMTKYNERPLYMLLNPVIAPDARELPLSLYIETIQVVQDKTITKFEKTPFEISADEAERITAVHCAKVGVGHAKGESALVPHLNTLSKSIGMLNTRVAVLHKFLADTQSGKIKHDHKILRDLKGMCNRLPTMESPEFNDDFLNEYNDALLVTYLASITKGTHLVGEVVQKFNAAYSGGGRHTMQSGGGRGRHMMF